MHFVSDPYKARLNLLKHRVSFEVAESVFGDKRAEIQGAGNEKTGEALG